MFNEQEVQGLYSQINRQKYFLQADRVTLVGKVKFWYVIW